MDHLCRLCYVEISNGKNLFRKPNYAKDLKDLLQISVI